MKVTFDIENVYIEMLDNCNKTDFHGEFSRSGLIRFSIKSLLERLGYHALKDLSPKDLMTLNLKEDQKITWIKGKPIGEKNEAV